MAPPDNGSSRLTAAAGPQRYSDELFPASVDVDLREGNQVGLFGERPLHVACVRGKLQKAEALVEGRADVSAAGELGNTPWHEAVGQAHKAVIRFLLQCGASPGAANELGQTPRSIAQAPGQAENRAPLR